MLKYETMKTKILSLVLVLPLLLTGCDSLFDKGDVEKVWEGEQVGFFPLSNGTDLSDGGTTIEVQLIGKQRSSDLTVNYSVDGTSTAVAGTHYNALSGSVTIPAGSNSADITITYIAASVPAGGEVELILNLDSAGDVDVAANLAQSTTFIAN